MSEKRSKKQQRRERRLRARRQTPDVVPVASPVEDSEETDLLRGVDDALDGHPLDLLFQVSGLLTLLDPRGRNPFEPQPEPPMTFDELVTSFIEVDTRETTALLYGFAALVENDLMTARIRRELGRRRHELPAWVGRLAEAEVYRVMEMSHILGDGDNFMLGARLPTGEELCGIAYVDHNVGTLVKDGFAVPESLDVVRAMYAEAGEHDPDTTYTDIDPADARAKITDAIATAAITYPPFETESWPMCRPLVEWLVRQLPPGGQDYEWPEWSDADQQRLADDFFASPFGSAMDAEDRRSMLDTILWFGCDYTAGDPLRWSGVRVEVLLADWLPRKVMGEPAYLALAPDVLRAYIRYCHDRLGIRAELTEETLAAVDAWTPDYLRSLRGGGGTADALARNLLDAAIEGDFEGTWEDWMLESLDAKVGGRDALLELDDAPLPDEPFDWTDVPEDIRPTVAEVLRMVDDACDQMFDVEVRTACRRLLRRAAVGDPQVFRRRAKTENAASAICWAIGSANDLFLYWPDRTEVKVKDLLAHFGIKGAVSQRADSLMRAAGIDPKRYGAVQLGTPDLLIGAFRAKLIARRDHYLAETSL